MDAYTFKISSTIKFGFTSNHEGFSYDAGYGTLWYAPIAIERKELTYDLTDTGYVVTAPLTEQFFIDLIAKDAVSGIELNIKDTVTGAGIYSGFVQSFKYDYAKGTVEIKCTQRFVQLEGELPKKTFSVSCPYNVGDKDCRLDMDGWSLGLADFTISGSYFTSDTLKGLQPVRVHNGFIRANTGEELWITGYNPTVGAIATIAEFYDSTLVTSLTLFPGCSRTFSACTMYGNTVNFGGYPHIPERNVVTEGFR